MVDDIGRIWGILVTSISYFAAIISLFYVLQQPLEALLVFVTLTLVAFVAVIVTFRFSPELSSIKELLRSVDRKLDTMDSSHNRSNPHGNPSGTEEQNDDDEPTKTTGGGAFVGMVIGGLLGLLGGPAGVVVAGVLGAIAGDHLEQDAIRTEKEERREEEQRRKKKSEKR